MRSSRVSLGATTIVLADGWFDITDDLPEGSPYTLGKPDGVGVLQFSTAQFESGNRPLIQTEDLRNLLTDFAQSRELGEPRSVSDGRGTHAFVCGDFGTDAETVHIWYVSNGRDVVLATYLAQTSSDRRVALELRDTAAMISSLDFTNEPPPQR